MYPKVGLEEETKEGEKEGNKDSKSQWNTSHLCRNKINEAQWKLLNTGKEENNSAGGYIDLRTMHQQV
jgi:hypothetical protein